jgi:cell division topological specificity factor
MGLFDYFRANRKSADVAKERLSILIACDRVQQDKPSFLPMLQKELLEVIQKYVNIDGKDFTVSLDKEEDCEILELNITLPDEGRYRNQG